MLLWTIEIPRQRLEINPLLGRWWKSSATAGAVLAHGCAGRCDLGLQDALSTTVPIAKGQNVGAG